MKKMMTALAAFTLVLGTAACNGGADTEEAASDGTIAGTWKADPGSAQAQNDNRNFVLADGEYTCNSCLPPFSMTANGEWQDVDRPGVDQIMIEVVDDNTVRTAARFEGRDLGATTWTVSEDGNSMKQEFVNMDGEVETTGDLTLTRVAAGPEGSHAMSGEWELGEYGELSDEALTFTYALDGDTLTSSSNGGGWTATFGGDPVAIEGDESGGMIQVERTGDNSHRETYTRDGEVIGITDVVVDGDTVTFTSTDPRDESVFSFTAARQ